MRYPWYNRFLDSRCFIPVVLTVALSLVFGLAALLSKYDTCAKYRYDIAYGWVNGTWSQVTIPVCIEQKAQ